MMRNENRILVSLEAMFDTLNRLNIVGLLTRGATEGARLMAGLLVLDRTACTNGNTAELVGIY